MTPFSNKLRSLRESRGVMQKSLATSLGVGATYLSALEQGRKSPPDNAEFYSNLRNFLQLTAEESEEITRLAEATEKLGPFAIGTSPMQLAVGAEFAMRLKWLEPNHLRAIQSILELAKAPIEMSTKQMEGVK